MIFEGERDVSLLEADRKGPDERTWFKDAGREGLLDGGGRALGAGFGAPTAKKAPPLPSDRAEGEEGRAPAVRFGSS